MTSRNWIRAVVSDRVPLKQVRFQTTHWSEIFRARDMGNDEGSAAWNKIAQSYWYPLYAFCRRRGASEQDAQDLTQGFFAHLMSGSKFDTVSPEKGRFRTFLLTSFKNYQLNQQRAASRIIRGGEKKFLTLDQANAEGRYLQAISTGESPERAFERDWAEALLASVTQRLANDYELAGKKELFSIIQSQLIPGADSISRVEIGQKLNLSPAAVGMSIHRLRGRYREILLEEIAATVGNSDDVEDELRNLMAVLRKAE